MRISGDPSKSEEDYYQELMMEFYPAVEGFQRKVRKGIVDGYEENKLAPFEEYSSWGPFNSYIKSCLWMYKARIGKDITDKIKKSGYVMSIDGEEYSNLNTINSLPCVDTRASIDLSIYFKEIQFKFTPRERQVLKFITESPSRALKLKGDINEKAIRIALCLTRNDLKNILSSIEGKINFKLCQ